MCISSTYGQSGIRLGSMNDPFLCAPIVNLWARLWTTDRSYCILTSMLLSTYGRAVVVSQSATINLRSTYCRLMARWLFSSLRYWRLKSVLLSTYGRAASNFQRAIVNLRSAIGNLWSNEFSHRITKDELRPRITKADGRMHNKWPSYIITSNKHNTRLDIPWRSALSSA